MLRATRPNGEGRIAIVTNAGRAAVDAGHIGARGSAGRATVSKAVARTTGVIGVRQNRVVLAPGVCAPSVAVMRRSNRTRASVIRRATGAIVHRSPGRARHKPFQPLRREGRDAPVALLSAVQCSAIYSWHSGQWEPAGSRSSLRPLSIEGRRTKQSSGEMRREDASVCLQWKLQAGEATSMHLAPSLRAQRSNPESFRGGILDCFAALAMTMWMQSCAKTPLSCPGRSAALLQRCAAEPGSMWQCTGWLSGSRLCGASLRAAPRPGHETVAKPASPYTASTPSARRPPGTPDHSHTRLRR